MPFPIEKVIPVLQVTSLDEALEFFNKAGFATEFVYEGRYAGVARDGAHSIHFSQCDPPEGGGGLYILVPDPDAAQAACEAAGLEIHLPPADQPYGMRDCTLKGPSGIMVTFGADLAP